MNSIERTWAVVLAAGSGSRLGNLTVAADGAAVPKQYCSLAGGRTLLEDTFARARAIVDDDHLVTVVAAEHRRWWQPLTTMLPRDNVIAQPRNRGTAVGIMLAALHLAERDPDATLALLPSDHFFRDEEIVAECLRGALVHVAREPEACVLIGIVPDEADSELGYIVPGARIAHDIHGVDRFVEKPDRARACELIAAGSVWNSFIIVAQAGALIRLCARRYAEVLDRLRLALRRDGWPAGNGDTLQGVYDNLPEIDFSRQVMTGNEDSLRLLPAASCGWTDLGTPDRVGRCVEQLGVHRLGRRPTRTSFDSMFLNLAQAFGRMGLAG